MTCQTCKKDFNYIVSMCLGSEQLANLCVECANTVMQDLGAEYAKSGYTDEASAGLTKWAAIYATHKADALRRTGNPEGLA